MAIFMCASPQDNLPVPRLTLLTPTPSSRQIEPEEGNRMRKTLIVLTALAGPVFAGGFYLQLGNPEASAEARKLGAVVTVKATGCHDPGLAKLSANAIGVVDGKRSTVPLEVKGLGEPGFFAVVGQWPKEGKWGVELDRKST